MGLNPEDILELVQAIRDLRAIESAYLASYIESDSRERILHAREVHLAEKHLGKLARAHMPTILEWMGVRIDRGEED